MKILFGFVFDVLNNTLGQLIGNHELRPQNTPTIILKCYLIANLFDEDGYVHSQLQNPA